jgi:predicted transcriptional regulator
MIEPHTKMTGLTKRQRENVGHFLDLFSDVEAALKKRLRLSTDNKTGVRVLISTYEMRNPYWKDSANRLRHLADIRNILTHQRCTAFGYPVAVTIQSVHALREIKRHLVSPEPVSIRYSRQVTTVSPSDTVAHVVALAFENGFSQFPVVDGGRFRGLVTETEITRWLGRRVKANAVDFDLRNTSVKTVLKEKDPTTRGISIFRFQCPDTPVEEVMGLFSAEATLEVVLLTSSGTKHTLIEGIITQWDAARFPHSQRRHDNQLEPPKTTRPLKSFSIIND